MSLLSYNIGAEMASGSFKANGMIVVPCSMKTLAGRGGHITKIPNQSITVYFTSDYFQNENAAEIFRI
jgi:hypothetical protein